MQHDTTYNFSFSKLLKFLFYRKYAAGITQKKNFKYYLRIFGVSLGYFLTGATTLGSLLSIMIVNANMTSLQRLAWTINFIQLIIQDNILNFIGYLALQYFLIRIYRHSSSKPMLQKKIYLLLNKQLFQVMVNNFFSTLSHQPIGNYITNSTS